ncbi:MAG: hypothetical protein IJF19_01305 [Clostridia bacterium]|nr:hypothetical protein [Clostridia bacterium]
MKNKNTKTQKGSKLIKILILVLVLSLMAIGGIIISDVFFSEESAPEITTITVRVSGNEIFLNGSEKLSLSELEANLTQRYENKNYFTVVLINDTNHPADIDTYNSVVDILGNFGITEAPLTLPATLDQLMVSSIDER